MRIVNLLFLLLLFLHLHACAIIYVASFNETWIPPSDRGELGIYNSSDFVLRYSTAIYYSLRLFTLHDISPTVLLERMMNSIFGCVCALVATTIVGNIYVLVGELNKEENC